MAYDALQKEEKRFLSSLMKKEYVRLKFSELFYIFDNNYNEPRWMDTYIMLYKASLPKNITAYDILLEKLSKPLLKFYFKKDDGRKYLVSGDEKTFRDYVWYLTTKEDKEYTFLAQYMPTNDYSREIFRFNKYAKCGLMLENVYEDEFVLNPIGYTFKTPDEARIIYEKLFDAYDLFVSLGLKKHNYIENFYAALNLGKDKKMIAVLSTMISYFDVKFAISNDSITVPGTNISINDEITAKAFESHMMDAYHFYRNVINTKNKKDIVSEVCNKKVPKDVMRLFTENIPFYSNIVANNKGLVDWIITISRESKYTLKIKIDSKGAFVINNTRIATEQDAEYFYMDYMENKSTHTAMVQYKGSVIGKIKRFFTLLKFKFWRKEKAK